MSKLKDSAILTLNDFSRIKEKSKPLSIYTSTATNLTKDNENFGTIYRCSWSNAGSHTLRFSGVATGYSGYMAAIRFYSTQYCVAAIDGSLGAMLPVTDGVAPKFLDTFRGTKIRSIPENLFSGIDTSSATNTSYMFIRTFQDTEITSIPAGLFSGIDTSSATDTSYMFTSTFQSTPITSIPAGLFSGIDTSSATNPTFMFSYTFYNCRSLAGYIPPTAFSKNIPSNNSVWNRTFNNTNLATTCPAGTVQYITRYEDEWNGNVSCQTCAAAGLPQVANGCRTPCSFVSELHIGDNVYPLYSDKTHASSPVLHVGSGNDVCYAFMEPDTNGDKPGLHINYNGNPHVVIAPQP